MKAPAFIKTIYCILFHKERKIIFIDFWRFFLGPKVINNKTINPWSDKTYTKEERIIALQKASQWLMFSKNLNKKEGFSYHILQKWRSSVELNNFITPILKNIDPINRNSIKNIHKYIYDNQLQNGWFKEFESICDLSKIAYTIYTFLEHSIASDDKALLNAATRIADRLFDVFNKKKYLKGKYTSDWQGYGNINLLGYTLMALVWLKLYKLTKNIQYLNVALKINDILIYFQDRRTSESENTCGAITGSFPIWKGEEAFCFSFWATKFFIDSLTLEKECVMEIRAAFEHEK